jgi:hypothetical protein
MAGTMLRGRKILLVGTTLRTDPVIRQRFPIRPRRYALIRISDGFIIDIITATTAPLTHDPPPKINA